jgi:HK97 family phage major capsid protein/HK97 family phage prohead protease
MAKKQQPAEESERKAAASSESLGPDTGVIVRAFAASGEDAIRLLPRDDGSEEAPARYEFRLTTADAVNIAGRYHETLGHDDGEVRMNWMRSGNAPLLWMHRHDQQLGVIESAAIRDGSVFVTVRFGSSAFAQEKRADVEDGILKNVSVGFRIHGWRFEREDGEDEFYRVVDWEPKEASLVTVPADPNTGFGRSASEKCHLQEVEQFSTERNTTTNTDTMAKEADTETLNSGPQCSAVTIQHEPAPDNSRAIQDAVAADRDRQRKIRQVGAEWGFSEEAQRACDDGTSIADFNELVLNKGKTRSLGTTTDDLGMSQKEKKRYSMENVLNALVTGNTRGAEHELEVSEDIKARTGRSNDRIAIPTDVLLRGWIPKDVALRSMMYGERATVGVGVGNSEAADLVATELQADMFIESLREQAVVLGMGVTALPGLVGNIDIPRELTNPSMYWVDEDAEPTEGDYTLDKVSLSLKTIAGRIPFTRKAGKQSTPNLEGLLNSSIRIGLANAIDVALINGDGTGGAPTGILNTSGIGTVNSGGTLTRNHLFDLEEDLANANATTSGAQGLTNTHGKRVLLTTKTDAGSGLFVGSRGDNGTVDTDVGNFKVSNNVPNNLGAGTDKTAVIFGNFSSLYMGMWGGVELIRDTSTKVSTGGVVLRVFQDLDCVVGRAADFSAIVDLT